jgi:hypothetical protein
MSNTVIMSFAIIVLTITVIVQGYALGGLRQRVDALEKGHVISSEG